MIAEGLSAGDITDAAVHHLALIQGKDGRWHNNLPRPPIQTSDVSATALTIYALQKYPLPGRKDKFADRIRAARDWLRQVKPDNTEERVYQLLGLKWAGEPSYKLEELARDLIAEQRVDGGWAQLPKLGSDAYATGQVLFALHEAANLRARDQVFEKGLRFLIGSQLEDGTWHVKRRAFPFQPTMRSGFSHGRDGWISATATSWAVISLSQAIRDLRF
jgi:N-acyl-D-amino-acid deacylase